MRIVFQNAAALFAAATAAAAFGAGCALPDVVQINGVAEKADSSGLASDLKPSDLQAYVMYKSVPCPDGAAAADGCFGDGGSGVAMSTTDLEHVIKRLDGEEFPAPFSRGEETAFENIRFTNDAHKDGNWSYGLVLLAPFERNNPAISLTKLNDADDATPFAIGVMVIEAQNIAKAELERLGLHAPDDDGRSVTLVKQPSASQIACMNEGDDGAACGKLEAVDPNETVHFSVATLGSQRDRVAYPRLFGEEHQVAQR